MMLNKPKQFDRNLIVIGGGPIGLELAQSYKRLGSVVTVIALGFLENEDPELKDILLKSLKKEGINFK